MSIEYRTRPDWGYLYRYLIVAVFLSLLSTAVTTNSLERFFGLFAALFTARQIVSGSPTRREEVT